MDDKSNTSTTSTATTSRDSMCSSTTSSWSCNSSSSSHCSNDYSNSNTYTYNCKRVSFSDDAAEDVSLPFITVIPDEILDPYMDPYEEAVSRKYQNEDEETYHQAAIKLQTCFRKHWYMALVQFNDAEASFLEELDAIQDMKRLELENVQSDLGMDKQEALKEWQKELAAMEKEQEEQEKVSQQHQEATIRQLKAEIAKQEKKKAKLKRDIKYEHKIGAELRKIGKRERKQQKKTKSLQKYQRRVKQESKHLKRLEQDIEQCRVDNERYLNAIQKITEFMVLHNPDWAKPKPQAKSETKQEQEGQETAEESNDPTNTDATEDTSKSSSCNSNSNNYKNDNDILRSSSPKSVTKHPSNTIPRPQTNKKGRNFLARLRSRLRLIVFGWYGVGNKDKHALY